MNKRSENNLATCHEDLQRVFKAVDKQIPIVITEGYRGPARQIFLYMQKKSKVKKGKHNKKPSEALDVYPAPLRWGDTKRMYYLAGVVMAVAKQEKVNLRWGGDWDRDTEFLDNEFNDLGHYELIEEEK